MIILFQVMESLPRTDSPNNVMVRPEIKKICDYV